jgi:Spy/CpxP family protein refolding chaperone
MSPSLAEPPPLPGDLNRLWAHEDSILSKLDLTYEQKKKVEILRNSLTEEMAPLRSLRYEKFTELKLLWSDPTHNKENVLSKMKEFHNLIWQIVEKEMNYRLTFKDILTEEQYSRYLDYIRFGGF